MKRIEDLALVAFFVDDAETLGERLGRVAIRFQSVQTRKRTSFGKNFAAMVRRQEGLKFLRAKGIFCRESVPVLVPVGWRIWMVSDEIE